MSDAIEALSVALGPGVILGYLWAGLFHPARKVRERYWVVYNHVYLRHQDAMVRLACQSSHRTLTARNRCPSTRVCLMTRTGWSGMHWMCLCNAGTKLQFEDVSPTAMSPPAHESFCVRVYRFADHCYSIDLGLAKLSAANAGSRARTSQPDDPGSLFTSPSQRSKDTSHVRGHATVSPLRFRSRTCGPPFSSRLCGRWFVSDQSGAAAVQDLLPGLVGIHFASRFREFTTGIDFKIYEKNSTCGGSASPPCHLMGPS
jgi:hypothetical protein